MKNTNKNHSFYHNKSWISLDKLAKLSYLYQHNDHAKNS